MKKLIYMLIFLLPVVLCAQQSWYKSSPLNYMWMNVGNAGFSTGISENISLAFSASGEPYIAYTDYGNSGKATVMKYDGANWVNVGNAGFSEAGIWFISFAFSPSGDPYVAYTAYGSTGGKATVMKFDSVFVGIKEPQESRLLLYPNPATDKITLEISGETTESDLAIVNINSRVFITCQITKPKTQIDITNLPSRVYFVKLTNDKTVEVGK
jgi:hypothetical protein